MSYIGNTPTTQAFTPAIDYFSGNGVTTAFTLSRPVASVAQVMVFVNNVPQNPSTAFTVSGNTITFTGVPSTGTNNIYVEYTSPITQVIAPSDGSVGTNQLATGAATTVKIADASVTPAKLSQPMTSSTAVASTSGTSIDFTGIPSWVKRITVMFNGVSTNGTSGFGFQVGSGSILTTGYTGASFNSAGGALATNNLSASVYNQASINNAAAINQGIVTFVLLGNNIWAFSLNSSRSDTAQTGLTVGTITLGGTLDRVRITTVNGTDTFDAGSINILYEG